MMINAEGHSEPYKDVHWFKGSKEKLPIAIFERADGWRLGVFHRDLMEAAKMLWDFEGHWWLFDTDCGGPEYYFWHKDVVMPEVKP